MGVNEGPWEKQHVAIISELQVERLESDKEWQSRLPEERLESSKVWEMCNQVKSRDESLESSQGRELRTKSHESGRWCDRRWLIWGEPQNDIFLGTIGRIIRMLGNHRRKLSII